MRDAASYLSLPGTAGVDDLSRYTILDFIPDAAFVVDSTGKAIAWNRAIEKLTGTPREQVLGTRNYQHAHPFFGIEGRPLIGLALERPKLPAPPDDSQPREGEILCVESFVPDFFGGRGGYFRAEACPFFDAAGKLLGAVESIRDITEIKRIEALLIEKEKQVEDKTRRVGEFDAALKVLLAQKEKDRAEIERSVMTNLKESLLPHIERLRNTALDQTQRECLLQIEATLQDILSPFLMKIAAQYSHLTPMEIRVANMVRSGKSSKEIAHLLNIAEKTVSTHRYNLRIKLGLKNKSAGLRTFLMSLDL